jgi:hypothetical protein
LSQAFVVWNIPVDNVVYNECGDEDVHVTGSMHLVINKNVQHLSVADVDAVGLSTGYDYASRGVIVENNIMYANPNEGTLSFRANFVSEDGSSFSLKFTFHLTVNANGEITASLEHIQSKCRE